MNLGRIIGNRDIPQIEKASSAKLQERFWNISPSDTERYEPIKGQGRGGEETLWQYENNYLLMF